MQADYKIAILFDSWEFFIINQVKTKDAFLTEVLDLPHALLDGAAVLVVGVQAARVVQVWRADGGVAGPSVLHKLDRDLKAILNVIYLYFYKYMYS